MLIRDPYYEGWHIGREIDERASRRGICRSCSERVATTISAGCAYCVPRRIRESLGEARARRVCKIMDTFRCPQNTAALNWGNRADQTISHGTGSTIPAGYSTPFGIEPSAEIAVAPIWSARMHKENTQATAVAVHQNASTNGRQFVDPPGAPIANLRQKRL